MNKWYVKIYENRYFEFYYYFIMFLFLLYFDPINAALVSLRDIKKITHLKLLNVSKHNQLNGNVWLRHV